MSTSKLADQLLGDPDRLKTLLSALATATGLVMIRKRDLERALTEHCWSDSSAPPHGAAKTSA